MFDANGDPLNGWPHDSARQKGREKLQKLSHLGHHYILRCKWGEEGGRWWGGKEEEVVRRGGGGGEKCRRKRWRGEEVRRWWGGLRWWREGRIWWGGVATNRTKQQSQWWNRFWLVAPLRLLSPDRLFINSGCSGSTWAESPTLYFLPLLVQCMHYRYTVKPHSWIHKVLRLIKHCVTKRLSANTDCSIVYIHETVCT